MKVLYVEGYPRWEYRYIKRALLRDRAVRISCLLTSADPGFEQEASEPSGRVTAFPETAEGLAGYDVVLFGDVDKRLFTDKQLESIDDFVRKHGGGFGMISGPRFAPSGYRDTPIAGLLPVNIERVAPDGKDERFSVGFTPALTEAGRASVIFQSLREPTDTVEGHPGLRASLQPLYWYCRGAAVRGAGGQTPPLVLAVHPSAKAPDGSDAPLLVLGQAGKGAVLFSAIDDSWRWRSGGGESAYVEYWVEQLRALSSGHGKGREHVEGATPNSLPAHQ